VSEFYVGEKVRILPFRRSRGLDQTGKVVGYGTYVRDGLAVLVYLIEHKDTDEDDWTTRVDVFGQGAIEKM
jgi:hypothetical protein